MTTTSKMPSIKSYIYLLIGALVISAVISGYLYWQTAVSLLSYAVIFPFDAQLLFVGNFFLLATTIFITFFSTCRPY
ncbi:MAG: hypothetical protein GY805_00280 [Chloroflexi bacterium]|nr:hypothetical protein [Chloroflexota bacterium]